MAPREGTARFAGLLEGPIPPDGDEVPRSWVTKARGAGVRLDFSTDGGLFSLIPHTEEAVDWNRAHPVDRVLAGLLSELMEALPEGCRAHCMCTLRSVEVLPGRERQTLYSIGPGGEIQVDQRDVEKATEPPPRPPDPRRLMRRGLTGAAVLFLLVLVSLPFLPYRIWWNRAVSNLVRAPAESLTVETGPFDSVYEIGAVSWDAGEGKYRIPLRFRTGLDAGNLEDAWFRSESMSAKLALEDVRRGEIECEIRSEDDTRIARLRLELRTIDGEMALFVPAYPRLRTVRLTL